MSPNTLKIGFARLSDCASLVAAKERGEFEKQGLTVELKRYSSWAAMRDALANGRECTTTEHMLLQGP